MQICKHLFNNKFANLRYVNYLWKVIFFIQFTDEKSTTTLEKKKKKTISLKKRRVYNSRLVLNRQACLLVLSRLRKPSLITVPAVRRQYTTGRGAPGLEEPTIGRTVTQRAISLPYIYGSCRHAFVPHCVNEVGGRCLSLPLSLALSFSLPVCLQNPSTKYLRTTIRPIDLLLTTTLQISLSKHGYDIQFIRRNIFITRVYLILHYISIIISMVKLQNYIFNHLRVTNIYLLENNFLIIRKY